MGERGNRRGRGGKGGEQTAGADDHLPFRRKILHRARVPREGLLREKKKDRKKVKTERGGERTVAGANQLRCELLVVKHASMLPPQPNEGEGDRWGR